MLLDAGVKAPTFLRKAGAALRGTVTTSLYRSIMKCFRKFRYSPTIPLESTLPIQPPPIKLSIPSMIHQFTHQIVHKLALGFNGNPDTLRIIFQQLCSEDFHVSKNVFLKKTPTLLPDEGSGTKPSNPLAFSSSWSDAESFISYRKEIEDLLPDFHFSVDSFRDYSSKSGMTIKCEYKYKATLFPEDRPLCPNGAKILKNTSSNSTVSAQSEILTQDHSITESMHRKTLDLSSKIRISPAPNSIICSKFDCIGTLFIFLNDENKINHLEFNARYLN